MTEDESFQAKNKRRQRKYNFIGEQVDLKRQKQKSFFA